MANQTITITNSLNFLGGRRPTLWGNTGVTTMTWGTDFWGYGEDAIQDIGKLITNALASDSAMSTASDLHLTITNTLTFSPAIIVYDDPFMTSTLTLSSDITALYKTSGIWFTVFPGEVTNSDLRITTDYTAPSSQSSIYATPIVPSTVWS